MNWVMFCMILYAIGTCLNLVEAKTGLEIELRHQRVFMAHVVRNATGEANTSVHTTVPSFESTGTLWRWIKQEARSSFS